jgi:DNA-binding NarL/FixJ family response regulator
MCRMARERPIPARESSVRHGGCVVTIRLVLCDEQPVVRIGVQAILAEEPDIEVVGEASDGFEVVAVARRLRPTVVLLDTHLPLLDGIQATRQLAGRGAREPIQAAILTAIRRVDTVIEALDAGATGFLLKDRCPEELVFGIRAVAAGHAMIAPPVLRSLLDECPRRLTSPAAPLPHAAASLTGRELEVLRLLARGHGSAAIAESLCLGEATVKTHIQHMLRKLGCHDRVQAVALAYQSALVQPDAR